MPTDDSADSEQSSERPFKREVEYTTRFKRDYKREKRGQHRSVVTDLLEEAIRLLADDFDPPEHYRDHSLTGDWRHHRDSHLKPDLVLIYRKHENPPRLVLTRLGSHSELGL